VTKKFVFNRNAVVPAGCIFVRENDATALTTAMIKGFG